MLGINHYDSACVTGYLFPISVNLFSPTYSICAPQGCYSANIDPVTALASLSSNFNATVSAFVAQNTTFFNGASNATITAFDIYRYVMMQTNTLAATTINISDWLGKDACRQDHDWLKFRTYYLSKKASLYHKLDSIYFLNPAAYGAPYGCSGSSNPPSGYISHFPNVTSTLSTLFPNSTNNMYTVMNTPTVQMSSSAATSYTTAASNMANTMTSSMNSTLSAQCASSCASYTNYWHSTLNSGCIAYGNANQTVKNNIMNALVGVCMSGCDYNTNLGGASTSSPNTSYLLPSTSQTVNSFQQVLNYYLTGNVTTSVCSAIILSQPAPYPSPTPTSQVISSCKCDQILQTAHDYTYASSLPPGVNAAWKLFRYNNGYDLPEFNILKCVCLGAAPSWTPGHIWSTPQLTVLAQNTMNINPKLKCISCMKCTDVVSAINGMFPQLPNNGPYTGNPIGAITLDSLNQLYAIAALDNQFGPHMFQDYLDLYDDCNTFTTTAKTFSNTITDKALDLFKYMNQLVSDGFLTKDNRPAKICTDSKYFLSSIYSGTLPNVPTNLTYSFTSTTNNATLSILSPTSTLMSIGLTFPLTYTGTWQSFDYMNNFVAWCPTPVAGNNYSFQVKAVDNAFAAITLTGSVLNQAFPIAILSSGSPVPQLCPKTASKINKCTKDLIENALTQADLLNQQYLESVKAQFQNAYKDACYAAINETFIRVYNGADEYQHTLYYYDESGNLQRTVPPNGVKVLTSVVAPIPTTSAIYPDHGNINGPDMRYVSDYRYTSYNQPLSEKTIDGGTSNYFYDEVGRIVASQNAKQAAASSGTTNVYSYSLYDAQGRITEVGQLTMTTSILPHGPFLTYAGFTNSITAATRTQVTQTYYDQLPSAISTTATTYFTISTNTLSNLRNRVSCVMYNDNPGVTAYQFATYYSYDDHGNVKRVTQENNTLPGQLHGSVGENLFKKIDYEFELISGNMVKATYQKNLPDQLIHKYYYDSDNRLHEVHTSYDDVNYDMDAKYFYYEHGPLARIERADKQVQGSDYMYTIHGWIKGINGEALNINSDAGKDGTDNATYLSSYSGIHNFIGKDAMSFSLNYYNSNNKSDYKAIKNANFNTTTDVSPQMSMANLYNNTLPFYLDVNGAGDGASLYNGNISSMVTSFIDRDPTNSVTNKTPFPLLSAYRYDQLHRIIGSKYFRAYSANTWSAPSVSNYDDSYIMTLSYDPNGNIQTLFRSGAHPNLKPGSTLLMDNLNYSYFKSVAEGGIVASNTYNSNKLACVTDIIASTNYTDDIDTYASCTEANSRYTYDQIGNLISDKGEYILNIEWTVDRKVSKVTRDATAMLATGTGPTSVYKSDIEYQYNAMRQRVVKIVKPRDQVTKALKPLIDWVFTYYVYDASGNVMATYDRTISNISGNNYKDVYTLTEMNIYGSSRLALARPTNSLSQWTYTFLACSGDPSNCRTNLTAINPPLPVYTPSYTASRNLGYKEFELSNHLGNVIATISDRKVVGTYTTGGCVKTYDFSGPTVPSTIIPQNMNLSIQSGSLLCGIQSGLGISGVNPNFGNNLSTSITYLIEYDFDPGSLTLSDAMYIVPYDYNGSSIITGYYFCDGSFVPPAGHYSFVYTPSSAGSTWTTSFAFNTNSSSTHTFIIDNITMCPINAGPQVLSYNADMLMHTDYYPFGQQMPARTWQGTSDGYRYSHNSHEKEDAIYKGAQSAEYWMYDSRVGRRWERDPIVKPWESSYAAFNNNPIYFSDPRGLEAKGGDKKGGDTRTKAEKSRDQLTKNTGKEHYIDKDGTVRKKEDSESPKPEAPTTGNGETQTNQNTNDQKVTLDAGHGDNNSKNTVYDPGAIDGTHYEKDYAAWLEQETYAALKFLGVEVERTRSWDKNVDPEGPINWRWKFANDKGSDIFISFHLNNGDDDKAFAVYQQGKGNEDNSIILGTEILNNISSYFTVDADSPVKAANKYTRFDKLGVLNNFNGSAGILIEFGGIKSEKNRTTILNNKYEIGKNIANAIYKYIYGSFPNTEE